MSKLSPRQKFIEFFESRGHKLVSPSMLIPENDPSVLFTTAGMQQFKGYYLNPDAAPAKRVITVQPCFRTSDIDEVGDGSHLTLFEMLGNFSFGFTDRERGSTRISTHSTSSGQARIDADDSSAADGRGLEEAPMDADKPYFKKEAIEWAWEFLTDSKWLGLEKEKILGTFFEGNDLLARDEESEKLLQALPGINKVEGRNQEENFWGPTGIEGPCGPTVEFHFGDLEVWNLVFNQYYFKDNNYSELDYYGVDTGAGLERLMVVCNNLSNVYETEVFAPLIAILDAHEITEPRRQRIVADNVRAALFALADGVMPSNKDAGYVVRRLIRRAMLTIGDTSGNIIEELTHRIIEIYGQYYPQLAKVPTGILEDEIAKWEPVKIKGEKILDEWAAQGGKISGKMAFDLYQSHGFPIELTRESAQKRKIDVDEKGFWQEFEKHKEISRAGVAQKFKGGLAGHSEIEIRYHTAAHLLLASLREVLGEKVFQRGANINTDRLRFDFSCDHSLTQEELMQIEALVNEKIAQNLPVICEEMTRAEADACGAVGTFKERYGDTVKIYTIGSAEKPCSKEFCGGPHVENTSEIGVIKITKEESAGAGIRRIRAKLE